MTSGQMKPLNIHAITASCAAGVGMASLYESLLSGQSGLKKEAFLDATNLSTWIGKIAGLDDISLPTEFEKFSCRNNHLTYLALQQDDFLSKAKRLAEQYGNSRVGVFVGTSTSGILNTELAYQEMAQTPDTLPEWYSYQRSHNNFSLAEFVSALTGVTGPAMTVSTACSSSAKVFATANNCIDAGLIDVAIVGGVDTLCLTTLYGFNSLQLLSPERCTPCDSDRQGINIGEAAGFALVSKQGDAKIQVKGIGESSDAYHMSSPHPEGLGAHSAMQEALNRAGIPPNEVDYINLHGTGTKANDSAECKAIYSLFEDKTPCSSTKAWMGHSLGAAGILEIAIAYLAVEKKILPANLGLENQDSEIKCNIVKETAHKATVTTALSNSFGFGGSNCSVVLQEAN